MSQTSYNMMDEFETQGEIDIQDLVEFVFEFVNYDVENAMAIKAVSKAWRWGALVAFHWEGLLRCPCGRHMLLNPTKLQKPDAAKDAWCCDGKKCGGCCTCNIPKCLKNEDELQEQIGGFPAYEFLAIDLECVEVRSKDHVSIANVYFDSWPQDDVVAIRFPLARAWDHVTSEAEDTNNVLLERFGPRNLRFFRPSNDRISSEMLEKCHKLKWLDCNNGEEVVDSQLMRSIGKLPALRKLSLDRCYDAFQDRSGYDWLRDNASVDSLSLDGCAANTVLEDVSTMKNLQCLGIGSSDEVSKDTISRIARNFAKLTYIDVEDLTQDYTCQFSLSSFTDIPSLRHINARNCKDLDDASLEQLATCLPDLESLHIDLCFGEVGPKGFAAIGRLTCLRKLSLTAIGSDEIDLSPLSSLVHIEWLDLMGAQCDTDATSFEFLGSLQKLRVVRMLEARGIADNVLQHLGKLTCLQEVKLSGSGPNTAAALSHLAASANLTTLCLASTRIDHEALRVIGEMASLRWLDVAGCRDITDEGLKALRGLRNLESLSLSGKVTAEGVVAAFGHEHAKTMTRLKYVKIPEEQVPGATVLRGVEFFW